MRDGRKKTRALLDRIVRDTRCAMVYCETGRQIIELKGLRVIVEKRVRASRLYVKVRIRTAKMIDWSTVQVSLDPEGGEESGSSAMMRGNKKEGQAALVVAANGNHWMRFTMLQNNNI